MRSSCGRCPEDIGSAAGNLSARSGYRSVDFSRDSARTGHKTGNQALGYHPEHHSGDVSSESRPCWSLAPSAEVKERSQSKSRHFIWVNNLML